ncbi:MAG: ImmA/IrrE family metallo-endopeptidase [Oscillospiraceae bacterium]|jgi:Zn-dependent peptidase ImmA (M78 family)|nr:ImmA/IrrE family metallo-endopeptidase [Oscillospiraceae bacterium]
MSKLPTPTYVEEIRTSLSSEKERISRKKIEESVNRILFENSISSPPVNVQKLAEDLGFDIFDMTFDAGSGIIGWMEDGAEENDFVKSQRFIGVDSNSDAYRKIGTIAHELGHFFMDCSSDEDYTDVRFRCTQDVPEKLMHIIVGLSDSYEEENAEAFKNELLMPWKIMLKFLRQCDNEKWGDVLDKIKKAFGVPRHTARDHLERKLNLTISNEDRLKVGEVLG